jgi:hypothetical protein
VATPTALSRHLSAATYYKYEVTSNQNLESAKTNLDHTTGSCDHSKYHVVSLTHAAVFTIVDDNIRINGDCSPTLIQS